MAVTNYKDWSAFPKALGLGRYDGLLSEHIYANRLVEARVTSAEAVVSALSEHDYDSDGGPTFTSSEATQASVTLSAGTHQIVAKCYAEYSIASVATVGLLLRTSGGGTLHDASYSSTYPAGSFAPLVCARELTVGATTTIDARIIKTGGGTVILRQLHITSHRVA